MARVLAIAVIGLPLLASALTAMAVWFARPATVQRIALAASGLTALLVLALLHTTGAPTIAVEWLPGAGAMGLEVSTSSLYVTLAIDWAAFLALFAAVSRDVEVRRYSGPVTLLALGVANAALLTDHFLARYAALEIVALCVALIPLIEMPGPAAVPLAWICYLLLRVGDAGLLAAILTLNAAGGTLRIGPALDFAQGAIQGDGAGLGWAVAGFALAAWVKMGGWPFHLWSRVGQSLSLASHAWLYAILVPGLGAYLLYHITPLLALVGPLQTVALWLGAGSAVLMALLALARQDWRTALVYVGGAQAGLMLFVAAAGVETAVWLGLLALTPVRLLLFLAVDATQHSHVAGRRSVSILCFGLGGLALTAFGLLTTWWARDAGAPLEALFVAEAAVAWLAVWGIGAGWRLSRLAPATGQEPPAHWTQHTTAGLVGGGVLAGMLAFGPLARALTGAGHLDAPVLPALPALLRYAVTSPALLGVAVLSLAAWRLQRRSRYTASTAVGRADPTEAYDLEEGLRRAAQALRAVVEVGMAERIIVLVVRAVVSGARVAYRAVEQEGLEDLLYRGVQAALALSRALQRWHTGRLRRNLLWVPIALALAVLALMYSR